MCSWYKLMRGRINGKKKMALCCNVQALCEAAVMVQEEFVGGGAWAGRQTQSSLGVILQCGVVMETASIVV